jgi:zona occludens toxin
MSIYAYTGLPGSGKSYSVVEHQVLPALKSGRRLVTNVALKFDKLREAFPSSELVELPTQRVQADPATIYEYVTPGSVVVLDEVWRLFPAGLKANHVPEPFRKLLAEHRHMVDAQGNSCQIVLVTQDLAQISAFARQLVEQTFRTVKLTSVGLSGQFRVDVYNGPATGPNPPESGRIRQLFGRYSSATWQYYDSHTLKAEGADSSQVNEKSVDRRANILARPVMFIGAVAAIAFVGAGVWHLRGVVNKQDGAADSAAAVAAPESGPARLPTSVRVQSSRPSLPDLAEPATLSKWTLVGFIDNLDNPAASLALLTDGNRTVSRPLSLCDRSRGWLVCEFPDLGTVAL